MWQSVVSVVLQPLKRVSAALWANQRFSVLSPFERLQDVRQHAHYACCGEPLELQWALFSAPSPPRVWLADQMAGLLPWMAATHEDVRGWALCRWAVRVGSQCGKKGRNGFWNDLNLFLLLFILIKRPIQTCQTLIFCSFWGFCLIERRPAFPPFLPLHPLLFVGYWLMGFYWLFLKWP